MLTSVYSKICTTQNWIILEVYRHSQSWSKGDAFLGKSSTQTKRLNINISPC